MSSECADASSFGTMVMDIKTPVSAKKSRPYRPRSKFALLLGAHLMGANAYQVYKNGMENLYSDGTSVNVTSFLGSALGVKEKFDVPDDSSMPYGKELALNLASQYNSLVRTPGLEGHEMWHSPDTVAERIASEANMTRTAAMGILLIFVGGRRKKEMT